MIAYYNEHDPKAAAWLRQLIKNGDITAGEVDERSITEVSPSDLRGFDRCHFFAGIGTWDYCLNQSGWGDKSIWTASLPCQPFSAAGKGLGKADERHLLPHFLELVKECRPSRIIGEQVSAAIKHGWLDDLYAEMEACHYSVGSAIIGAHSVNAPHIRQRLYWVANSASERLERPGGKAGRSTINGEVSGMANSNAPGKSEQGHRKLFKERISNRVVGNGKNDIWMANSNAPGKTESGYRQLHSEEIANGTFGNCADDIEWIYCQDNKYRPIKSSIQPLVDGLAKGMVHSSDSSAQIDANATQEARVMRLKGYGNAIQAQTAIAFISAYMELI